MIELSGTPCWFVNHGLVFKSPFLLHGVEPISPQSEFDVEISFGKTPAYLVDAQFTYDWYEVSSDKVLYADPAIGRFIVEDGNKITIEKSGVRNLDVLISYVNASAVGALLHQRKQFPLHGSCVARDGEAFVFCGDSGAGKSTTAAYLLGKGYELVCDDVVTVNFDESGTPLVVPSNRSPKIWNETVAELGLDDDVNLSVKEYEGTAKNVVNLKTDLSTNAKKSRLTGIYMLRWAFPSNAGVSILKFSGLESMHYLKENVFRSSLVDALGNQQDYFDWSSKLLNKVGCASLARGRVIDSLSELELLIDS